MLREQFCLKDVNSQDVFKYLNDSSKSDEPQPDVIDILLNIKEFFVNFIKTIKIIIVISDKNFVIIECKNYFYFCSLATLNLHELKSGKTASLHVLDLIESKSFQILRYQFGNRLILTYKVTNDLLSTNEMKGIMFSQKV